MQVENESKSVRLEKKDAMDRVRWKRALERLLPKWENLQSLITCAREQNVIFIYAISPGLDMTFSNSKEVDILKKKIKQIADLGCKAFALLFDDIDPEIRPADRHAFESFAHAQVSVTNQVFKFLNKPKYFLVCPTEYAASRAVPSVDKSSYLSTLGSQLNPAIDIMWTGPKVISKVITTHSIRVVTNVLKRKPIIWDNIHANDYDQRRLFLGPYDGRPIHLYTHLRGIFTNPNCEFESNFIALHTLSTWIKCAHVTFYGEEEDSSLASLSSTHATNAKDNKVDSVEPMEDESVMESSVNANKPTSDTAIDHKEPEEKLDATMETDTESDANPNGDAKSIRSRPEPVLPKSITILKAYDPEQALRLAAVDWLKEFSNPKNVIFNTYAKSGAFSVANNATPVQTSAAISTQTSTTSASFKDAVKMPVTVPAPSPVKAAKEKSRIKMKKTMEIEPASGSDSAIGEEMEVVDTKTELKELETVGKSHELPTRLTVDDLLLLVDFFYLPHQHGKRARQILNEFKWLKANSIKSDDLSDDESAQKIAEWKERAKQFHGYVENVSQMFIRLSDTPNRAVLYDLFPYIWDVKEVVLLLDSFIKWLDSKTKKRKEKSFIPEDPEPWVIRGGICGEMQRLLPMLEGGSDLFTQGAPQVPTPSVYTIRPFIPADKEELYEICLSTCDDGQDGHDLFPNEPNMAGDRFIGPYMSICPETMFVVEDKFGLCGYGVAAADGRHFYDQYKDEWLPQMCKKYSKPTGDPNEFVYSEQISDNFHNPSIFLPDELYNKYPAHVRIDLLSRAHSLGIGKRLLACILSVLKSEGCRGVYVEIQTTNRDALDFYSRLGFADVPSLQNIPEDIVILGRTI